MLLQRYYNPVFSSRSNGVASTTLADMVRQFDQLFNNTDTHSQGLPLNIIETDNHYQVMAFIPLVNPDLMELSIRDRQLHIKINRPEPEKSDGHLLLTELPTGTLERWVQFEKDISPDASASLKEGVLTLTIQKKQVQHSIPIQVSTH